MAEGPVKWAFALVHGIGITKPMDLIGEVTSTMNVKGERVLGVEGPSVQTDEPAEAHTAPAELRSRSVKTNAPKRRQFAQWGTFYGERARFAAMEWSDISFYKDGIINMIGGLLLTSFGVRYFAQAAGAGMAARTASPPFIPAKQEPSFHGTGSRLRGDDLVGCAKFPLTIP